MFKPGNPGCGCCDGSSSSSEIIPSCEDGIRYGISLEISGAVDCTDYAGNLLQYSNLNGVYIWEYPNLAGTITYASGDIPVSIGTTACGNRAPSVIRIGFRVRCFESKLTHDNCAYSLLRVAGGGLTGSYVVSTSTIMPDAGWDFTMNINNSCPFTGPSPCNHTNIPVSVKWRYLKI